MNKPQPRTTLDDIMNTTDQLSAEEASTTEPTTPFIRKPEETIKDAQGIVYLIAVFTTLYFVFLGFTTPDPSNFALAGVAGIVLGTLGFFSGRSQYVLMAALTLFFIDTVYSFVAAVQSYSEQGGNSPQISEVMYILRFYMMKEMVAGIKAFRTLRRMRRHASPHEDESTQT